MKTLLKSRLLLILLACAIGGCSSSPKTTKQERAYEKYVHKSSVTRQAKATRQQRAYEKYALKSSGARLTKTTRRQQRAYEKYVRKSTAARQKQQAIFHSKDPKVPPIPKVSDPTENIATGPESMTMGSE